MPFITKEYENGTILVVDIPERLTIDTADELKKILKENVDKGVVKLVMNLETTNYMDSSGLGAIVSKIAVTRSNKGDIRIANVNKYVEYLLELTHLDKILISFPSVEEAVNSFKE